MKVIKNILKSSILTMLIGISMLGIIRYTQDFMLVIIFIINIISYSILFISNIVKDNEIQRDNLKIEELKGGNERLQNNYDNIRCFRHDFSNIMQAMGGYIKTKDLEGLSNMYSSIIKECQDINNLQSINKNVINNAAVYNLINNKYQICKKYDIKLKVEVLINLQKLKVKDFDLCRILGILIDNAIDATKECDDKIIIIRFMHDDLNNRELIIIENTFNNCEINVNKIFEKGFSSKKEKLNHGLGLWKVKQIIRKNKNLGLYTDNGELFKQQLEIYN